MAERPRLALAWRIFEELAPLLFLGALLWMAWPRGGIVPGLESAPPPWWGGPRDRLLDGPDAGEWARNANLVHAGRWTELDHHRLPSWLLLLSVSMELIPDVALAGHLGNRLLLVLLTLSVYGIGRLGGSRSVGLLAAGLALSTEHLCLSSQRFGVDIVVASLLPAGFFFCLVATRVWWLALPAGLFMGFTMGVHYTTLPYALPMLVLMALAAGPGPWKKLGAVLLYAAGVALAVRGLLFVYPVPNLDRFVEDIANGIAPGYRGGGAVGSVDDSLAKLKSGMVGAIDRSVATAVGYIEVPMMRALFTRWSPTAAWLGVFGVGLGALCAPLVGAFWVKRGGWRRLTDLSIGLPLLLCLAPLPVLAAAGAPARYASNLLPFVALLVARGLLGPLGLVEALVARRLEARPLHVRGRRLRWPSGLLTLALALPCIGSAWEARAWLRNAPHLSDDEIGTILVAEALRSTFPEGTAVACPLRESVFMAGMRYCPDRICPTQANEAAYRQCLTILDQECSGDAPIGYVASSAKQLYDPNATARPQMDAWVDAQWPPATTVTWKAFSASVYAIPRSAVPEGARMPAWGSTMPLPAGP